jgi:hypothetical protein
VGSAAAREAHGGASEPVTMTSFEPDGRERMPHFRALLGPVRTEKETYFEVLEVDDAGDIEEIGDGASAAEANTYVDESVCEEDDDGELVPRPWVGTPSLVRALGLGTERVGTPSEAQRRALLLSAFTKRHDVRGERAWDGAERTVEAALAGFSMLVARALPRSQSWTVRATLELDGEAARTLHAWVWNGHESVTIACADHAEELLEVIRASGLGRRPMVRNFVAVRLDRTHGWLGRLTAELLPIGVEPEVTCHLAWSEFADVKPRPLLELAAIAAAFSVSDDGVAGGEAVLDVGPTSLRCVLTPVRVEVPPLFG